MADTRYPYRIRAQFTARQEAGLREAAARHEVSILEMIRRYVVDGLARDGITGAAAPVCEGQTTIDDTEGDQ